MTITNFDGFAVLPKRCDFCNRLFVFEVYNIEREELYKLFKRFGMEIQSEKLVKCMKCIQKDGKKLDDSKVRNAVDVVRCCDCKNKTEIIGYPFCERNEFCIPSDSEYFCAYGERAGSNGD